MSGQLSGRQTYLAGSNLEKKHFKSEKFAEPAVHSQDGIFYIVCRLLDGGFFQQCFFNSLGGIIPLEFSTLFPGFGWVAAERATIKEGGRIISRLLFRLPPARQQNNKEIQSLE